MCVCIQWAYTHVSTHTQNTIQWRYPRNSWTRSLKEIFFIFFLTGRIMLMYTLCFWHLPYFTQWLSIFSICTASCLGAVAMDITFPSPTLTLYYPAFSQTGNLLWLKKRQVTRSCTNLNLKKKSPWNRLHCLCNSEQLPSLTTSIS